MPLFAVEVRKDAVIQWPTGAIVVTSEAGRTAAKEAFKPDLGGYLLASADYFSVDNIDEQFFYSEESEAVLDYKPLCEGASCPTCEGHVK